MPKKFYEIGPTSKLRFCNRESLCGQPSFNNGHNNFENETVLSRITSGLYYKLVTIVIDTPSVVSK
jgi:hypothetical protein